MCSSKKFVKMFNVFIIIAIFLKYVICEWESVPYNREDLTIRPGYEDTWMYIPDGYGVPQVAFLKGKDNQEPKTRTYKSIANDITYDLYTRNNECRQLLKLDNAELLKSSNIDLRHRATKFIIHGWLSSNRSNTCQDIKDAYLKTRDLNVIVVDWAPMSKNYLYTQPVKDTRVVGMHVAKMMQFLVENGAKYDNIHCVGHSLGAQVCGFAGQNLGGKLGRITGLDPAQPQFSTNSSLEKLESTDAKFVDIIHTCGGVLGYGSDHGHADFYPNGGTPSQPGCYFMSIVLLDACSHGRSWQFFVESILEPKAFQSRRCASWDKYKSGECKDTDSTMMGEHVNLKAKGSYFLWTSSEKPFREVKSY